MKQTSCLDSNGKTLHSIDFTTDCPKRRAKNPCKYCYVEAARTIGCNAKLVHHYRPYRDEVKQFKPAKIAALNAVGGLRMFSFGDYMPEHDEDIKRCLDDCLLVGLDVKAITKQPAFIEKYHDHPAIKVINVSIDNVGDGVDWLVAQDLKARFSKVRIRCAVMRSEDIAALPACDVYTFNHAAGLKKHGYTLFSKKAIAALTDEHSLHGKVCCSTGKCSSCALKCGL